MSKRNVALGLFVGACVVSACASVLGIEELGSSGTGGTNASGGNGGASVTNAGGATATAGSNAAGDSTGGSATGGSDVGGGAGMGGGATAGAGGQSMADAGADARPVEAGPSIVTVTGRVIDRWRHPMANVPMLIAGKPVTTDATGGFTMAGVQTPYDVNLVVQYSNGPHSWLYQGISRANPTLQVDTWVMPFRYAQYFDFLISMPSFPLPNTTYAGYSWGSADGNRSGELTGPGIAMDSAGWSGPVRSAGTSHALKWLAGVDLRPTAYNGYDFLATTLEDNKQTTISLNLTKNPTIASGAVSGSIVRGKLMDAYTDVYVTFSSGANIKVLGSFANTVNNFSYVIPTMAGATATICVQEGARYDYPYTIVHKTGLAPGTANVSIPLPDPAVPNLPLQGATVSTTTDFSWAGPNVVYLFTSRIQDTHYRVLTTQKTARLPKFVPSTGIVVPPNVAGWWQVEIHGPYASMDAATDVKGFVNPIDYSASIDGPIDRDGELLLSLARDFMTSGTP